MKNSAFNYLNILAKIKIKQQQHPFHLVDPSPWPYLFSVSLYHLLVFNTSLLNETFNLRIVLRWGGGVAYFPTLNYYFAFHLILLCSCLFLWFVNISIEASYRGQHSIQVQKMLRNGFLLFIVSEVMFFFSFFWSFFHLSVSPSIFLGGVWPAEAMTAVTIKPYMLPLLNTLILLCSGVVITWFHLQFVTTPKLKYFNLFQSTSHNFFDVQTIILLPSKKLKRKLLACIISLFLTICLGLLFTSLQLYEYIFSLFNISDSVYGSIFYLTTGFHGAHVIVGTILLSVSLVRLLNMEFLPKHHVGLEAAIYYWHFVDVVWLFLYYFVYIWGQ